MNLKHLRKNLPNNWASEIAKKHGVTASYARLIMVGKRENTEIAFSIIMLAETHKKKILELQQRASEI